MLVLIKKSFFIFAIVTLAIFVMTCVAESQDAVMVMFAKGKPKIMKADKKEWADCAIGTVIVNGDRIKTGDGDIVEICFLQNRSNVIRVEENSDVFIKKGQPPYSIELLNGAAMALIQSLPANSSFEVRTPTGVSGARGTGWRSRTTGSSSTFEAYEHSIYAGGIDASGNLVGELNVPSGFRTIVAKFEKPSKLEELSQMDLDKWNRWKEDLSSRLHEGRGLLDKAAGMQNRIEKLESDKDNVNDARDTARIEKRMEPATDTRPSSDGGQHDHYNIKR